jgi:predicted dehydrogenase
MTTNVADAKAMLAKAKETGKLLMCGHNQRFTPECQRAAELVEDGVLGEVYHGRCGWIRRRGIPGLGGWFTTKELSGAGPLYDIGIHLLDRTWYMMGRPKPVAVSGVTYAKFNDIESYVCTNMWSGPRRLDGTKDVEDFASALVRFENGASLQIEISWAANRADQGCYSILMGDRNGISVDGQGLKLYGQADNMIVTSNVAFDKSVYEDRHQHFVNCITYGDECMCPAEDGVVMQTILCGIQQSAQENREIRFDD